MQLCESCAKLTFQVVHAAETSLNFYSIRADGVKQDAKLAELWIVRILCKLAMKSHRIPLTQDECLIETVIMSVEGILS